MVTFWTCGNGAEGVTVMEIGCGFKVWVDSVSEIGIAIDVCLLMALIPYRIT